MLLVTLHLQIVARDMRKDTKESTHRKYQCLINGVSEQIDRSFSDRANKADTTAQCYLGTWVIDVLIFP